MSRVTIESLMAHEALAEFCEIEDIEIVPRKMVEMIIERCSIGEKLVNKTTAMEVRDIRNYAESLLKKFEEDQDADSN